MDKTYTDSRFERPIERRALKIVHIENNLADAEIARELLTSKWPECEITRVADAAAFRDALANHVYDIILADFNVPNLDGHRALRIARELSSRTPLIFLSSTPDSDVAIDLVRDGAWDYVFKDRIKRLLMVIPRALDESEEYGRLLQVEAELRESEERFRSIFITLGEGVVVLDEAGAIISANPSAERILGTAAGKLIGQSGKDWPAIREDNSTFPTDEFPERVALRTGKPQLGVTMGLRGPRGLIWIVANAQPLIRVEEMQSRGVVVTFQDVTEKFRIQVQSLRAQRLESLGLLAAGIAHDLNNVLTPVLMGVPLMRNRLRGTEDRKLLDIFLKSAERGAALARQILAFTKGSLDEQRLVRPGHLLRELQAFLETTLPKSIRLELDSPAESWPVKGNPTQLHQLLLNLCVNARDSMAAHGGTLRIAIRNQHLDLRTALALRTIPPGRYVVIEVIDAGAGIPSDVLAQMWEPFFSTKGADKGTGLGLSTVRGIIQNHHGHIGVETKLGQGSTFRVFLPAVAATAQETEQPSASPFGTGRGRGELILIVDDENEIRALITTLLTEQGYSVISATDGLQAYSQLLQRGDVVRLIVTDLSMPELDGVGLAMLTRCHFPTIKILAISGKGSATKTTRDYRRHTDAFLPKPFKPRALFDIVDRLLHADSPH